MTYFYVISAVLNAKSTAIPPKQQGFVINSVYNMSMSVSALFFRAAVALSFPLSSCRAQLLLYCICFVFISSLRFRFPWHIETITIRRDTQLCASTKTCVLRGFYISLLASSQQHKAGERRHDQLVAGCQASADTWDNDP